MAQALIKSISNNKPSEQCAGSGLELAVQWQEPRGTRRRGRVKCELPHGGAARGDGGEGFVRARAWGQGNISRALAGNGGSPWRSRPTTKGFHPAADGQRHGAGAEMVA